MAGELLLPRDLRLHIGQLVITGFDGLAIPVELRALAREFDLGGVILFARNVEAPDQVAELSRDVQQLAVDLPLWVSVDQEGGRVARLRTPFTEWPPMRTLGQAGQDALAARFARALAEELRAVGVSLDFAPVLDIHTNAANSVIGDRALSDRADVVARLGRLIVERLQDAGVAACGKHFPGHGDTATDSHFEMPIVDHPADRIRGVEIVPFRAAIDAGVAAIMTAHVLVPSLDEEHPATLSPAVVRDLLKGELGYDGLIVSDDLEMGAIAQRYRIEDAAVKAIAAGCDVLLLCGTDHALQASVLEALIYAAESGELPVIRVEDALARHRRAKERFLLARDPFTPTTASLRSVLGREEHLAVAAEMAQYL
jgi:beta-N-acetylhexosaminidase